MNAILKFLENLGAWVVTTFHTDAFVDSLQFMGKGMAGILIVTAVIIGFVYLLNVTTKEKKQQ